MPGEFERGLWLRSHVSRFRRLFQDFGQLTYALRRAPPPLSPLVPGPGAREPMPPPFLQCILHGKVSFEISNVCLLKRVFSLCRAVVFLSVFAAFDKHTFEISKFPKESNVRTRAQRSGPRTSVRGPGPEHALCGRYTNGCSIHTKHARGP